MFRLHQQPIERNAIMKILIQKHWQNIWKDQM